MYHKMQKMVKTYKFSTWEKAKHEFYPLYMSFTLVPMGLDEPPTSLRNP